MIAQLIYHARTEADLTQARLAKLVGTRQSVISHLEDADYDGHFLSMLRRIAEVLGTVGSAIHRSRQTRCVKV